MDPPISKFTAPEVVAYRRRRGEQLSQRNPEQGRQTVRTSGRVTRPPRVPVSRESQLSRELTQHATGRRSPRREEDFTDIPPSAVRRSPRRRAPVSREVTQHATGRRSPRREEDFTDMPPSMSPSSVKRLLSSLERSPPRRAPQSLTSMKYEDIFAWCFENGSDECLDDSFWEKQIRVAEENGDGDLDNWISKNYAHYVEAYLRTTQLSEEDIGPLFILAVETGHTGMVLVFLRDIRVSANYNGSFALTIAIQNGYTEIVRLLISDPTINPGDRIIYGIYYSYPIFIASSNGYVDIVRILLKDLRVNPSVKDNYAIKSAIENGHYEVVEELTLAIAEYNAIQAEL